MQVSITLFFGFRPDIDDMTTQEVRLPRNGFVWDRGNDMNNMPHWRCKLEYGFLALRVTTTCLPVIRIKFANEYF